MSESRLQRISREHREYRAAMDDLLTAYGIEWTRKKMEAFRLLCPDSLDKQREFIMELHKEMVEKENSR